MQTNATTGSTGHMELLRSVWAVRVITVLVGAIALLSLLLFGYQVQCPDPKDLVFGGLYRDTPGAWLYLFGHLLRGTLLTWLFICLLRYSKALRRLRTDADLTAVNTATVRGWNALGWTGVAMTLFGFVVFYDLTWGLPKFPQSSASRFPASDIFLKDDDDIELEFREAAYEPREGLIERSMTVTEPVKKQIFLSNEPIVETQDVARIAVGLDEDERPTLDIRLTDAGAARMLRTTETLSRKYQESRTPGYIALTIDGKVETVPMVRSPVSNSIEIRGNFTKERAESIAKQLNETIARRTKK